MPNRPLEGAPAIAEWSQPSTVLVGDRNSERSGVALCEGRPAPCRVARLRRVSDALEGFLREECDDDLAARLRGAIAMLPERGYDYLDTDLFRIELFAAEGKVTIAQVADLGYDDAALSLTEFLHVLPEVPSSPPASRRPAIVLPPPGDS